MILWEQYTSTIAVGHVEGVLSLILLSLLVMTPSLLLEKCYGEGMILRRFFVFLIYLQIKFRRNNLWQRKNQSQRRKVVSFLIRKLSKLISCVYCSNVWLSGLFLAYITHDLLEVILGVGMSNMMLIMYKKFFS